MFVAGTKKHHIFDTNGKLLEKKEIRREQLGFQVYDRETNIEKDFGGNEYTIENGRWFPKVIKQSPDGSRSVVVTDPFYMCIVNGPRPAWCLAVAGLFMAAPLGIIVKVKTRKSPKDSETKGVEPDQIDSSSPG